MLVLGEVLAQQFHHIVLVCENVRLDTRRQGQGDDARDTAAQLKDRCLGGEHAVGEE